MSLHVSIHATLAGGDVDMTQGKPLTVILCFYPRHPRGWRPVYANQCVKQRKVSIHATLAGGDGR